VDVRTLTLARTEAEAAPGARAIDGTPPGELVEAIFAHDRVVLVGQAPARVLDLRGEVCPFTFVRTKLALEELGAGERVLVRVDHEPATRNVPKSAAEWGQRVLGVALSTAGWDIWIEKT
jgi:tRNA 2-thiouridine synthesizing protein A